MWFPNSGERRSVVADPTSHDGADGAAPSADGSKTWMITP